MLNASNLYENIDSIDIKTKSGMLQTREPGDALPDHQFPWNPRDHQRLPKRIPVFRHSYGECPSSTPRGGKLRSLPLGVGGKPLSHDQDIGNHISLHFVHLLESERCFFLAYAPKGIQIFVIYKPFSCIAGVPSSDEAWGAGHHDAHLCAKHDVCLRLSSTSVRASHIKIDTDENYAIKMSSK